MATGTARLLFTAAVLLISSSYSSYSSYSSSSSSSSSSVVAEALASQTQSWGTKAWNWGYASGGAHDAAALIRRKLDTAERRREWLQTLVFEGNDADRPDLEEIKLCFALRCQRAFSQRMIGGYSGVYDALTEGAYEDGGSSGPGKFWADLEEELPSVGVPLPFDSRLVAMSMGLDDGDEAESLSEDRQHCVLAAAVLMQMGLIERGL